MAKKKEKNIDIVYKPIKEVIPYEKNPRKNDKAVKYVANSIKEFGFKVPCIIDKNNVLVAGHTRLKAAKQLGLKTVPCIIADDLTEEQVKAFRLADNSVAEFSTWDIPLLVEEVADIMEFEGLDFKLDDFGFNMDEETGNIKEEEIIKVLLYENLQKKKFPGAGEFDIPKLKPLKIEDYTDCEFIPFTDMTRKVIDGKRHEYGVHYFIQDYTFKSVWDRVDDYTSRIMEFSVMITPDFSTYVDFPKSLRIWNHYRNMWIGAYLQSLGHPVIPNIGAAVHGNEFLLDGVPKGGVIAWSTHGGVKYEDSRKILVEGYERMLDEIKPKGIVWFGGMPKDFKVPNNCEIFRHDIFPLKQLYK